MKLNRYLKELGLTWYDLPGNYDPEIKKNHYREMYRTAAANPANKEDDEGFCEYETYSLNFNLDLILYSKISYFREFYAPKVIPVEFIQEDCQDDNSVWLSTLDEILEGLKLAILQEDDAISRAKITKARQLLAVYWNNLWW